MLIQGYTNIFIDTIRMIRLYVNDHKICMGGNQTEKKFNEYEKNMPKYMRNCIGLIEHKASCIVLKTFSDKQDLDHNSGIIIGNKQEWDIMPIVDMNELYIPLVEVSRSDIIIEQKQQNTGFFDGPFFFLPYCHVYKCIVGIRGDDSIHSVFPHENKELIIHKNEFVAFDYNRDPHYIYKTENNNDTEDESCIMLKLHYILFPMWLPLFIVFFYKKLHIWFNTVKWVYKNM
jgi:hypothetical protein